MVLAGRLSCVLMELMASWGEMMGQNKQAEQVKGEKDTSAPFRLRHPIPTAFPPVEPRTAKP